jgi:hypothetical protein
MARYLELRLVDEDSCLLGAALGRVIERRPEGGTALAVGHSPIDEAAVLGLAGSIVEAMPKSAGVPVIAEGDPTHAEPLPRARRSWVPPEVGGREDVDVKRAVDRRARRARFRDGARRALECSARSSPARPSAAPTDAPRLGKVPDEGAIEPSCGLLASRLGADAAARLCGDDDAGLSRDEHCSNATTHRRPMSGGPSPLTPHPPSWRASVAGAACAWQERPATESHAGHPA